MKGKPKAQDLIEKYEQKRNISQEKTQQTIDDLIFIKKCYKKILKNK